MNAHATRVLLAACVLSAQAVATQAAETLTDAAGMTLYTFAGDKAKGDMAGDGLGGVWHVAVDD